MQFSKSLSDSIILILVLYIKQISSLTDIVLSVYSGCLRIRLADDGNLLFLTFTTSILSFAGRLGSFFLYRLVLDKLFFRYSSF